MGAISQQVQFVEATVDTQIPAMQNELKNGLRQKVNVDDLKAHLDKKADKDIIELMTERLNKMEEVTTNLSSKITQEVGGKDADGESGSEKDEDEEDEANGSPGDKRRGTEKGGSAVGVSNKAVEDLQNKIEETEKKLMEMM